MTLGSANGAGSVPPRGRIDFETLKQELLSRAEQLVPMWLPGGRMDGPEYKCADLSGGQGGSCSINVRTGQWADFAHDGEKGGDLISLYAAIHGMEQADAARELIEQFGISGAIIGRPTTRVPRGSSRSESQKTSGSSAPPSEKGEFVQVVPVPANAPPRPRHKFRGDPSHAWAYERDGQLYGYVCRFTKSDGGKEVIPCIYGQSRIDGSCKWIWKHWDAPKPLYLPAGRLRPGVIKVVVEGEKCADALHKLIGADFDVLTWPGGTKAVEKADWSWLAPSDGAPLQVFLWPDADSKRRQRSAEEKAAGWVEDDARLDYLPDAKQPGLSAMAKLAGILATAYEAKVWVCKIEPVPKRPDEAPAVPDGWDCADAIEQGWDAEQCKNFLRAAKRFELTVRQPEGAPGSAGASGAFTPAPGDDDDPKAWRLGLIRNSEGVVKSVRENIVLALQSLPETRGQIAFNEFTNDVIKLADMPWGSAAGKWSEVDELHMGEWLCRAQYLPSMPRNTLEEGMRMVAARYTYHPVREYVRSCTWDGTPRLNGWLIRAVVGEPEKLSRRRRAYLQRVGAWFIMGMVSRAMRPGCKFDYMPILEGEQGMRKSTVLNVLAGEWFADTGFVLGDKDSLQMLQGRWLYEISELDAMARAEVTKIKAFVASKSDWYRASFDKRPREYPRQLVFAGTTNEHHYLVDGTGNRRFWPIEVTRVIDTEWVELVRDQLFAEAWHRLQQKERFHPTTEEELELFLPEQKERMVESAIEIKLLDHLVNHPEGSLLKEAATVSLLGAIGIDITKLGPGRFHEKQAATALRKFGWKRKRSSRAGRPWVYEKPTGWPQCMDLEELDEPQQARTAPAESHAPEDPPVMAGEPADYDDNRTPDPFY